MFDITPTTNKVRMGSEPGPQHWWVTVHLCRWATETAADNRHRVPTEIQALCTLHVSAEGGS